MQEPKKNLQESKICPVQLSTLKNFITLKPSLEGVPKEAGKVVELLLALFKQEEEKKKVVIDTKNSIKLSSNLMQNDVKKEQKSEAAEPKSNYDVYKAILHTHILTAGDFKTLSTYLKSEVSQELREKIEKLLKDENEEAYKKFIEAELVEVDIKYEELNKEQESELNSSVESMKLFESLLLDIPEMTLEEFDVIPKDLQITNKSRLIAAKKQQINVHEMLKKTFNSLDFSNKEKFNRELKDMCKNSSSKDTNFGKSLYSMCKRFSQQNKNKAASKLVQR